MEFLPWTSIGAGCFMFLILERFAAIALHYSPSSKNYRTRNHSLFVGTCLSLFNSILESAEQQINIKANEDDASFQTATREDLPKLGASMALRVGEVFARITGTGEAAMQPGDISAVSASDLSRYLATRMNNQLLFGDELAENDEFEDQVIDDVWDSAIQCEPMHYTQSQVYSLIELQETAYLAIVSLCQQTNNAKTLRREIHDVFQSSVENPHEKLRLMDSFLKGSAKLNRSDAFTSFALKHILVHLLTNFDMELATPNSPRLYLDVCVNLQLRVAGGVNVPC